MQQHHVIRSSLSTLRSDIKAAIANAPDDPALVDVLGLVRHAEIQLADLRKTAASELPEGTIEGKAYVYQQSRVAKRSFNLSRLFVKIWDALENGDIPITLNGIDVIAYLVKHKVIKLSWSWTNLKKLAEQLDLPLTVAQHEITEGDEADVGEVWGWGTPSYKGISPE